MCLVCFIYFCIAHSFFPFFRGGGALAQLVTSLAASTKLINAGPG